jgi:hypothetical protein
MITGNLRRTALAAFALFVVAGCSSQRIENAGRVADAGVAFADSVPTVVDESFTLAVTADSLALADSRPELTEDERSTRLQKQDELLIERLAILRDLKRHARLLRSYFTALGALVQSDATTGISSATGPLVNRLSEVGLDLSKKKLGGVTISEVIQPAVEFGVATYQNIALGRELKERGHVIERELELERAVLSVIGEQMMADKDAQIEHDVRAPLFTEYVAGASLPGNWNERRNGAFRQTIDLQSLNAAVTAADNLHQSWIAFAESRLDEASLLRLLKDVEEFVTLADKLKSNS